MSELFLKIVNMSISASWAVVAVLALRFCLKKAPKWVNVLLWGIVAMRMVFPFSIESVLSLIPSAETISPTIMMEQTPSVQTGVPALNHVINPVISGSFTPAPGASANPLQIWIPILTGIWLFGVAALFLYSAASYWRLRRKVCEAVILRGNIYQSENVCSPFVLGIIKPKIYLPYHMDSREMDHVIAHEQTHIRRKDHWWKPLGFLLLTIHWFNPLMWLSYILLCRDIELACDEKVIREMGNEQRADYTQALVACSVGRRVIAACPLAFGEVGVKERVKSVMNYKKPTFWIILLVVIACIALVVCFLTDPVDSKTEEPADTIVSNTENTPDSADTTLEESSQPTVPSEPEQPTEQDVLKGALSAAEEADTSILDELISNAVLDHYADAVQPGQIHVESHVTLAEDKHDTQSVTVYLLVLQEIYSVDGESLTLENGSYIPTAITFSLSTSGGAPIEYWEPSDGSYSDDIRAKFPSAAADEALQNDQAYIEDLKTVCYQKALEAKNGAAS